MRMGDCTNERLGGGTRNRDGGRPNGRKRRPPRRRPSESDRRRARLVRVIEGEIVPRLVLARGQPVQPEVAHVAEVGRRTRPTSGSW